MGARRGRPAAAVELSGEEREALERWARRPKSSQAVHVVLDNVSTHKTPAIQRWLVRHPRFKLHFTPT